MRIFLTIALAATISALVLSTAGAGPSGLRDCGNAVPHGAGAYDVRASKNVSCKTAKRVASRFFPGGERRFNRWRCSGRATGYETGEGRCGRYTGSRRQLVRFGYGS